MPPLLPCEVAYEGLAPPIHRPLDLVADDVVDPIGGDQEGPVCVLCSRGYLERLILAQLVRDLGERLPGFIESFIDSIHHTSESRGLINAGSGTGSLGAASGGALHRFWLVRLLAWVDQPYHHTISHALILLYSVFSCEIVSIARGGVKILNRANARDPPFTNLAPSWICPAEVIRRGAHLLQIANSTTSD